MMEEKNHSCISNFVQNSNSRKKIDGNRSTRWKTIKLLLQKNCLKIIFKQSNELSSKKAIKKTVKVTLLFQCNNVSKNINFNVILTKVVSTNDSISFTREGERIVHFTQQNFQFDEYFSIDFSRLWDRVCQIYHIFNSFMVNFRLESVLK